MTSDDRRTSQRTLKVIVTNLEMTAPPRRPTLPTPLKKLAVLRAEKPTLSFYRYLYETVGAPWHWSDRRVMDDTELVNIIHDDKIDIFVLYVAGVPAGFTELDFRASPQVEITHLGLVPDFAGEGLGSFLLNWSIDAAWRPDTEVVTVTTTTADHPRALSMYQRAGFSVISRGESYLTAVSAFDANPATEQDT